MREVCTFHCSMSEGTGLILEISSLAWCMCCHWRGAKGHFPRCQNISCILSHCSGWLWRCKLPKAQPHVHRTILSSHQGVQLDFPILQCIQKVGIWHSTTCCPSVLLSCDYRAVLGVECERYHERGFAHVTTNNSNTFSDKDTLIRFRYWLTCWLATFCISWRCTCVMNLVGWPTRDLTLFLAKCPCLPHLRQVLLEAGH